VRLIALDLDGTLLARDGRAGERNTAALLAAEAAGIAVVIATGRRHCYAMRVLRELGLDAETVLVSSNGTVIRTIGGARLIGRTVMPLPVAHRLCANMGEFRNALVITFDRVAPDGEDTRGALVVEELEDLHSSIGRWMEANAPYIAHVRPIEDALRELPGSESEAPIQMMLCGTVGRMRAAEARLLELGDIAGVSTGAGAGTEGEAVTLHRTEYPERDLSILDILPGGCSKGVALAELAASRGLHVSEVMAIGDNWNDLSMLEVAGFPVLMGNAPDDLLALGRERGWRIAGMHDADAVAEVIEELLPLASEPEACACNFAAP
jgi:hydroxymethylpyrimidine pyrophosphatase-like HAD family hydrolase